jgi:hypothetical protein
VGTGVLSPGIKYPGLETDLLPPSGAEAKNARDNFTFIIQCTLMCWKCDALQFCLSCFYFMFFFSICVVVRFGVFM